MAVPPSPLGLHEEVVLLALLDEEGTVDPRAAHWSEAFAAAALAELALRGRLGLVEERGGLMTVDRGNIEPEGDEVLDPMLKRIRRLRSTATLAYWTATFAADGDLRRAAADGLVARGILSTRRRGSIPCFTWESYPAADGQPEAATRERLLEALRARGRALTDRTRALCAVVVVGDLVSSVLERAGGGIDARAVVRVARSSALGRAILDGVGAIHRARDESVRIRGETLAKTHWRRFGRWS